MATRTKRSTQITTEYTEHGALYNLHTFKNADLEKTDWAFCGSYPTFKAARKVQDAVELYGQCTACGEHFYCPHKGAGQYSCTAFKPRT